ncbi:Shedu anti-phage system protein SduA domain-containing protein [Brevundimonas sp. DWR2-3-1b1]|uniref:Shedu anti-phage system protein SduA domain-containing protein n=1 Tax=unclassified Brevundimonas TaxID=2622653 RepID=UPI003CE6E8C5
MSDDIEYIKNYTPNKLYIDPARAGAFAKIAGVSEEFVGEIDVTDRCKIAVSAFYVRDRKDFDTFKLTKLKWHKLRGWELDGHMQVNRFQLSQIGQFLGIIQSLDLSDANTSRLSLDAINLGALGELIGSNKGADLLRKLAETPELHQDIYAVASKRQALADFEAKIGTGASEGVWQAFFEANPWIFGHGLNYIALDKVGEKLEAVTTGAAFDQPGKKPTHWCGRAPRSVSMCWSKSRRTGPPYCEANLIGPVVGACPTKFHAVTQIQKTTFEFARRRLRDNLKDDEGNDTGEAAYAIEPRSYLVVGNTSELKGNEDKIACFELYRRNIRSPEILTFDELLYRARYIVQNISREVSEA